MGDEVRTAPSFSISFGLFPHLKKLWRVVVQTAGAAANKKWRLPPEPPFFVYRMGAILLPTAFPLIPNGGASTGVRCGVAHIGLVGLSHW
ncbi:hypothetical protein B0G69_4355 [Paraburkholderia sp. RAU2J]|uniref:hypothetical protein n=1 Tax=Paraburkholderia sp. RAU2J TaxID=1938810 RepID=UPI000F1019B8|nr:hypothetical protein [Paraburkholderia sp. RAU2J]RKT20986.1 hypothetical protein B0G69_4355 [Paraburkholderia sp. RAU2J]